jgi:undecaprenyl-diphosphatase
VDHILQAVILGLVEGITEFLPISSTGHLIVAERLIGFRDPDKTFTVVIQIGAILAVVWYYRSDLIARLIALFTGRPNAAKFWVNLIIATIPAAVFGLGLETFLNRFESPTVIASALIIGGVILWLLETVRGRRASGSGSPIGSSSVESASVESASGESASVESASGESASGESASVEIDAITPRQALLIGLAQTLAVIFPGTSRSGASIVGGWLVGLNRVTATAFSFYLGLPTLGLAGLYKLYKARDALSSLPGGAPALLVGTFVSGVSAFLVVGWLLRFVSSHDFKGFAIYRVVAGAVILGLVAYGWL